MPFVTCHIRDRRYRQRLDDELSVHLFPRINSELQNFFFFLKRNHNGVVWIENGNNQPTASYWFLHIFYGTIYLTLYGANKWY